MPFTFKNTPELDALRAAMAKAQASESALSTKVKLHRDRAPKLAAELAAAMASGDGTATRTLRAERDALETDLRDLDAALRVAGDRIETAARDLARAEYPLAEESLHDLVARFNAVVDAAHELARELRAAQPEVSSRWARAGFSEAEPSARPEHPAKAVPAALSPLARVVVRAIGDLT